MVKKYLSQASRLKPRSVGVKLEICRILTIRGVAVCSVVLFHAFPKIVPGGFIGVDIFFVISGFLISSILFDELHNSKFSIAGFYSRRIRRIFPALIVVMLATFCFGWFILLSVDFIPIGFVNEFKQLGKHMMGGVSFVSNFILWNESGYFDNIAET